MARVEAVSYKTSDIKYASATLVRNFIDHSGIKGVHTLIYGLTGLLERIENQNPQPYRLRAPGINIDWSGYPRPVDKKEDQTLFENGDLGFTISENGEFILPSARTYVEKVTSAISEEMGEVFKLKVRKNPYILTFPKEVYTKNDIYFLNIPLLLRPTPNNP